MYTPLYPTRHPSPHPALYTRPAWLSTRLVTLPKLPNWPCPRTQPKGLILASRPELTRNAYLGFPGGKVTPAASLAPLGARRRGRPSGRLNWPPSPVGASYRDPCAPRPLQGLGGKDRSTGRQEEWPPSPGGAS